MIVANEGDSDGDANRRGENDGNQFDGNHQKTESLLIGNRTAHPAQAVSINSFQRRKLQNELPATKGLMGAALTDV
jgi:hypothetical protein